jgi:hypothetical protein
MNPENQPQPQDNGLANQPEQPFSSPQNPPPDPYSPQVITPTNIPPTQSPIPQLLPNPIITDQTNPQSAVMGQVNAQDFNIPTFSNKRRPPVYYSWRSIFNGGYSSGFMAESFK